MKTRNIINIDLDQALSILTKGVHRADIFMGIGINAAEHEPPISHTLDQQQHAIQLVKERLTPEERTHVNSEFIKWIQANGLREIVETTAIYMDYIYFPLSITMKFVDKTGKKLPSIKQFERMGISDKIEAISRIISVPEADMRFWASLNQARNCYAHRLGLVAAADIDPETGSLSLFWQAFQLEIVEPNGNVIPQDDMFNRVIEDGGKVRIRVVERYRQFEIGSELMLTKRDLKEICLAVSGEVKEFFKKQCQR